METEPDFLRFSSNTTSPLSGVEESSLPMRCQLIQKQAVKKQKPESAQHSLEMAKLSLLQQIQIKPILSNVDSEELVGQQVPSELRNLRDRAVELRLGQNIINMIYDTQEADNTGQSQYHQVSWLVHLSIPRKTTRSHLATLCNLRL